MASKIDTVSARDKLRARRGPHWHRVSKGSYLGFRRMTREANGTWLAPLHLTVAEKAALVAFLRSLDGANLDQQKSTERFR